MSDRSKPAVAARQQRRRSQGGFSLLMAVFMVATMLILAAAAAPNIITEGRRVQETEMIWRGEQYQRAIGLYFRKFGRYPTKIEDLTQATNGLRFLRQAYKDPTNKEDGSWRFIYVGPNGQLIGSTNHVSLLQGIMSQGAPGIASGLGGPAPPPPNANGTANASPNNGASASGASGNVASGNGVDVSASAGAGATANAGASQTAGGGALGFGSSSFGANFSSNAGPGSQSASPFGQQGSANGTGSFGSAFSASQPVAASDISESLGGTVIGGNIIGVGSKTKKASLKVYNKADRYDKWEFIYNPLQQVGIAGQSQPVNANPGIGQPNQQQGTTQSSPFGLTPFNNAPQGQSTPPQTQNPPFSSSPSGQ